MDQRPFYQEPVNEYDSVTDTYGSYNGCNVAEDSGQHPTS